MEIKEIPGQLKKLAEELRKKAKEVEHARVVKSAQVLVAAQGLATLGKIIYGEK